MFLRGNKFKLTRLSAAIVVSFSLIFSPYISVVQAQSIATLPVPGQMVGLSNGFAPALIKGLTIDPEHPLKFNFIIDSGETKWDTPSFKAEGEKLIRYFLAALTIPDQDLWVNLSPLEENRIISDELIKTEMGQDMLAQDYILKQITSSLIYPESELGKAFWNRIYQKAHQEYGITDVPSDTFHKVWIVPAEANLYFHENTIFVGETHLNVMMEEDLELTQNRHETIDSRQSMKNRHSREGGNLIGSSTKTFEDDNMSNVSSLESKISTDIMRSIILPELEKEVNHGAHFAPLRQVYHSLILAKWYKDNLSNALINQVYKGKEKVFGIDLAEKGAKQKIYQKYIDAYKQGVFNYVKEEYNPLTDEQTPRKYFSGGNVFADAALKVLPAIVADPAILSPQGKAFFDFAVAAQPASLDEAMATSFPSADASIELGKEAEKQAEKQLALKASLYEEAKALVKKARKILYERYQDSELIPTQVLLSSSHKRAAILYDSDLNSNKYFVVLIDLENDSFMYQVSEFISRTTPHLSTYIAPYRAHQKDKIDKPSEELIRIHFNNGNPQLRTYTFQSGRYVPDSAMSTAQAAKYDFAMSHAREHDPIRTSKGQSFMQVLTKLNENGLAAQNIMPAIFWGIGSSSPQKLLDAIPTNYGTPKYVTTKVGEAYKRLKEYSSEKPYQKAGEDLLTVALNFSKEAGEESDNFPWEDFNQVMYKVATDTIMTLVDDRFIGNPVDQLMRILENHGLWKIDDDLPESDILGNNLADFLAANGKSAERFHKYMHTPAEIAETLLSDFRYNAVDLEDDRVNYYMEVIPNALVFRELLRQFAVHWNTPLPTEHERMRQKEREFMHALFSAPETVINQMGTTLEQKDWFVDGHPSAEYHGIEHTMNAAFMGYNFVKERGLKSFFMNLTLINDYLHDYDPERAIDTPARVPATLERLEKDVNRELSLDDKEGESVIRDVWKLHLAYVPEHFFDHISLEVFNLLKDKGYIDVEGILTENIVGLKSKDDLPTEVIIALDESEQQQLIEAINDLQELPILAQRAYIMRSEFPFLFKHPSPFYQNRTPFQMYVDMLREIAKKDPSGEYLNYVMREAPLFSEYVDKMSFYIKGEETTGEGVMKHLLDVVGSLVNELNEVGQNLQLETFAPGSYIFLDSIGTEDAFRLDYLAARYVLEKPEDDVPATEDAVQIDPTDLDRERLDLPLIDDVLDMLPPQQVQNYHLALAAFEVLDQEYGAFQEKIANKKKRIAEAKSVDQKKALRNELARINTFDFESAKQKAIAKIDEILEQSRSGETEFSRKVNVVLTNQVNEDELRKVVDHIHTIKAAKNDGEVNKEKLEIKPDLDILDGLIKENLLAFSFLARPVHDARIKFLESKGNIFVPITKVTPSKIRSLITAGVLEDTQEVHDFADRFSKAGERVIRRKYIKDVTAFGKAFSLSADKIDRINKLMDPQPVLSVRHALWAELMEEISTKYEASQREAQRKYHTKEELDDIKIVFYVLLRDLLLKETSKDLEEYLKDIHAAWSIFNVDLPQAQFPWTQVSEEEKARYYAMLKAAVNQIHVARIYDEILEAGDQRFDNGDAAMKIDELASKVPTILSEILTQMDEEAKAETLAAARRGEDVPEEIPSAFRLVDTDNIDVETTAGKEDGTVVAFKVRIPTVVVTEENVDEISTLMKSLLRVIGNGDLGFHYQKRTDAEDPFDFIPQVGNEEKGRIILYFSSQVFGITDKARKFIETVLEKPIKQIDDLIGDKTDTGKNLRDVVQARLTAFTKQAEQSKRKTFPKAFIDRHGLVDVEWNDPDVVQQVDADGEMTSTVTGLTPDQLRGPNDGTGDSAMLHGGIDFDLNKIRYTYNGPQTVSVTFDEDQAQKILEQGFDGFVPLVINITPIPSVLPLLGLAPNREEDEIKISKK